MPKISTRNLSALPDIETLKKLCKSLAVLEAIICRDWESRYYSYNKNWDVATGEEFFEMRNGSGDQFQILFTKGGCIVNGLAHESEMNNWVQQEIPAASFTNKLIGLFGKKNTVAVQKIWKGVVDTIPEEFKHFIFGEPVKSIGTTFCIWRMIGDSKWSIGDIQFPANDYGDGSQDMLYILDNNAATYKKWAAEYYEEQGEALPLKWIKHIYEGLPVTRQIITAINPDLEDFDKLKTELEEIGYTYTEK